MPHEMKRPLEQVEPARRTLLRAASEPLLVSTACRAHAPAKGAPTFGFEVIQSWPHDTGAFTQGLVYHEGTLYESTGLQGESSLRQVALETGEVLRRHDLADRFFGEGLALFGGRLHQLTWRSQVGFIYDAATFLPVGEFHYTGEGWGLTDDGTSFILSDGTSTLRFLAPVTFAVRRTVTVTDDGEELWRLNELQYVNGEVLANVWMRDVIARIDPATGRVTGWINLTGLLRPKDRTGGEGVLNGIAYDAANDRLFVTGKRWPRLFQIRLVAR